MEGISVEDQVLLLAGTPLEDSTALLECGVTEHSTLDVVARLLGGQFVMSISHMQPRQYLHQTLGGRYDIAMSITRGSSDTHQNILYLLMGFICVRANIKGSGVFKPNNRIIQCA